MAEVKIDISANDGASATMEKVGEKSVSMGEKIKQAAAGLYVLRTAFDVVVGSAKKLIGIGADMVSAYSAQEKAEKSLIAAHDAMGEAGERYIQDEKRIAAAIQDETGVGDEVTLQRMARARALGVETNKLGEAARGVIALTNVGMAEEAATRALAQAYAGNYTALQRYIPALKEATTEEEKQEALTAFLSQGYDRQKQTLDTVQGSWAALKGRIVDAKEVVGQAIVENLNLSGVLNALGEKVKSVSARMAEWCQSGGLARAILFMRSFAAETKANIAIAVGELLKWYELAKLYIGGPFKVAGATIGAFFNSVVEGAKYAGQWAEYLWKKLTGKDAEKPSTQMLKAAWDEIGNAAEKTWQASVEAAKKSNAEIDATMEEVRRKRDEEVSAAQKKYFDSMDKIREKAKDTGDKIEDAASTAAKVTADTAEKAATASADAAKRAAEEARREIEKLQKEADAAQKAFAGMNIAQARKNDREREKAAKEQRNQERDNEKWQRRMEELARRQEQGGNLSNKQKRELEEYERLRLQAIAAQQKLMEAMNKQPQAPGAPGGPQVPGVPAAPGQPAAPGAAQKAEWATEATLQKVADFLKKNLEAK